MYLGYFCHLVTDAVWGIDVYMPMKRKNIDRLKTVNTLYKDYHRMNELLRRKYALEEPVMSWLEHGIEEKEKLLWELAQEKSAKAERRREDTESVADDESEKKVPLFSQEEAHELEELLRTIIGNKA